jgi:hypothetical protein
MAGMDIGRVDKKRVVENLKPVFEKGRFRVKSEPKQAVLSVGGKPRGQATEVEYAENDEVKYTHLAEAKTLFIAPPNSSQVKARDDTDVWQARSEGYSLIVINSGEEQQDGLVYDKDGNVIAQVGSYRRGEGRRLLGMKAEKDEISLFAEGGEGYFYELRFPSKPKSRQPAWYNISAL